ncbi:MAG: response regulator transcription factor [Trueperaceae bacterium]|nr:response regulator transcription factor [Trueperaceae bacterium]
MKVLITDDEAPARGELRYILEELEPSLSLSEARNGEEALASLSKTAFDVVFLDINMPGQNGLSVASSLLDLPEPPLIVFATAYDEHALQAFELEALDYVLKPFNEKRLAQTLERVQQTLQNRRSLEEQQAKLRSYLKKAKKLNKLWAELNNDNRILLDYSEIFWLEAKDKKVYAHTYDATFLLRYTLKELEELLLEEAFIRIHKGIIVNMNHMAELVPWFSGNYLLRMRDEAKTELSLSRRYAAELKELTSWR